LSTFKGGMQTARLNQTDPRLHVLAYLAFIPTTADSRLAACRPQTPAPYPQNRTAFCGSLFQAARNDP
jgi:hypothetical protein